MFDFPAFKLDLIQGKGQQLFAIAAAAWRELVRKFRPSLLALRSPRVAGDHRAQTMVGTILAVANAIQPLCEQNTVRRNLVPHQETPYIQIDKTMC
jgi:hypothetical protein